MGDLKGRNDESYNTSKVSFHAQKKYLGLKDEVTGNDFCPPPLSHTKYPRNEISKPQYPWNPVT
jgi:hypothetical protein